ncbi:MAG TPA: TIGR02679 family protein [Nocardioidaceae bacterium]|nr:TIGR02679 family protein [Nocardioidaceae bacterium]
MDRERLQRLLGGADIAWLVDRLVARAERGRALGGTVTLATPTVAQRAAVERLLGRRPTKGESLSVPVPDVARVLLDAGVAPDLMTALSALRGPLRDLAGERVATQRAWERADAVLDQLAEAVPGLVAWREQVRARGLLRRISAGPDVALELAEETRRCVLALPAADEPRSVFAARVLGDGHGLDDDKPLATLVHGAAQVLGDLPPGEGVEWRRSVWESVGVLTGDLSAPVLTLGLRASGDSLSARLLAASAEAGEPVHLSLRQLTRHPPGLRGLAGQRVFVCENPAVVAVAAERLGPRCAPLVCGGGHLSGAARKLLRILAEAGAVLRYHGDFDWAGLTIAGTVVDRYGALPWRLDAAHYLTAVRAGAGSPLQSRAADSPWEPALAEAMGEHRVRIEEEHVLDDLLGDLLVG